MAASLLLTTDSTGSSKNIYSTTLELATYTATGTQWVMASVRLSSLNGAAATITLTARHYASNGTTLIREQSYSFAKPQTASTVAGDDMPAMLLGNGEKLTIAANSTNSSDTSTGYTISWANVVASDLNFVMGTAVTAATAGILDTNVKNINNTAAATPGANGGLVICGSNYSTTFATLAVIGTTSLGPVTVTNTGGNGITISGSTHDIHLVGNGQITNGAGGSTVATVLLSSGTGAGQISLTSGAVTIGTNNDKTGYTASTVSDKTGYSLTQAFPTNFSALGISAGGKINGVILTDTATTLTNLPAITAGWLTSTGIAATALNGKGDWVKVADLPANFSAMAISVDGAIGEVTFVDATAGVTNPVTLISAYDAAKTAATQTSVTAIKTKTDQLVFTVANQVDANALTGGGGGGGGSGANAVTITVTDGSTPIQSAHVRVTRGVLSYLVTSDSSGYAAFSLDDGSWIISITASGYTFAPVTLAIDASHRTFTEAMTEHSVPTPSTGQCVGTLVVLDGEGSPRAGVTVDFEAVAPTTGEGFVYDGDDAPYVSDTSGVISRLFPSGSIPYRYRVGEGKWVNFTTSANDGDTFIIASNVSG